MLVRLGKLVNIVCVFILKFFTFSSPLMGTIRSRICNDARQE